MSEESATRQVLSPRSPNAEYCPPPPCVTALVRLGHLTLVLSGLLELATAGVFMSQPSLPTFFSPSKERYPWEADQPGRRSRRVEVSSNPADWIRPDRHAAALGPLMTRCAPSRTCDPGTEARTKRQGRGVYVEATHQADAVCSERSPKGGRTRRRQCCR
jgi:hypothetical protein